MSEGGKKGRKTMVEMPVWVVAIAILVLLFLVLMLWSVKRRQATHLKIADDTGDLAAMKESIAGLSQGVPIDGNAIEVVQNGAFFDGILRDIAAAEKSIHFESYVWWKGDITQTVAEALAARAREGISVRVLLDASGSTRMESSQYELMEQSGVRIARFHPLRLSNLGRMNNRDHRKIMVVDGRIGWISGHGIAKEWTGAAQDRDHWRDTAIRLRGPIVNVLQSAFSENWIEETGDVFAGDQYFPRLSPEGNITAHVAYTSPAGSVSSVELLHLLAIASARKSILIQNPYFLPDPEDIEIFAAAVRRGVDVRVMMPGDEVTDSAIVQHASHHRFGSLLEKGIRMFEQRHTLIHQKIIVVDGVWSSVGSTNFDDRSFEVNDEISVAIHDEGIARQLREAWDRDMEHAYEWKADEWKKRSPWHRLVDFSAYLLNEQL